MCGTPPLPRGERVDVPQLILLALRSLTQAFGDFNLGAPWVGDIYNAESRSIGAVPDRGVGLDACRLKFSDERIDVSDLKTHVVHRAAFRRHLSLIDFIERNLSARNIGGVKLSTLAGRRAEVVDVPFLSRQRIGHP